MMTPLPKIVLFGALAIFLVSCASIKASGFQSPSPGSLASGGKPHPSSFKDSRAYLHFLKASMAELDGNTPL
ncbi:MAG TPA: hypothetical protein VI702_03675, partial [Nitrospiria bacterium]